MKRIASLLGLVLCSISASAVKPTRITVAISPTTATVYSGGTKQFTATVSGTTNTAVTWSTTGGIVASAGLYTAPSVTVTTTTYVTATSVADSTKRATATVTVNPSPPVLSRIVVSPTSASLYVGSTQQFSAVAYDQYGHTLTGVAFTFSSGNYGVAGIDAASGLATGAAAGTAYINAYSGSVTSSSATLSVNAVPPPSPLTLTRLSPNFGLAGMNGDFKSLTIIGTGFVSGATVSFGADVLTPSAVTSTSVTVTIPVAEFSTVRTVSISVTNPGTAPLGQLAFLCHQSRIRFPHLRRRVLLRLQQGAAHPRRRWHQMQLLHHHNFGRGHC